MRFYVLVICFTILAVNSFAFNIEPYTHEFYNKESAFKLVFCPLNYAEQKDFLNDLDILINRLEKTKPFDEFNNLSIWYIDNFSQKEQDVIFRPAEGIPPLAVHKDFLKDISMRLKSEYKLIILDAAGYKSCAELSNIKQSSLLILGRARFENNQRLTKAFLHELGHSLGLRDESLNSDSSLSLPGEPNCARTKKEAQGWWGDLVTEANPRVNYIAGCCGNKAYIRPTIASLMNDPAKAGDFGPVNERYLKQELTEIKITRRQHENFSQ